MESNRKRQNSQPVEDIIPEVNVPKPSSPTKRQRTSSNATVNNVIDPALI